VREESQETGRKQLLSFLKFMVHLPATNATIREIGNAYKTAMRTRVASVGTKSGEAYYDGVIGIQYSNGTEATCYIESKAAYAPSSISNLPKHLESFIVTAYSTFAAWKDDIVVHQPIFIFVTNKPFFSNLLKHDTPDNNAIASALDAHLGNIDLKLVHLLCQNVKVIFYQDWLQELMG
jgi:hypothetical protein